MERLSNELIIEIATYLLPRELWSGKQNFYKNYDTSPPLVTARSYDVIALSRTCKSFHEVLHHLRYRSAELILHNYVSSRTLDMLDWTYSNVSTLRCSRAIQEDLFKNRSSVR